MPRMQQHLALGEGQPGSLAEGSLLSGDVAARVGASPIRWLCTEGKDEQCLAVVIPDRVTSFDDRFTTGICFTHSYAIKGGTKRLKKKVALRRKD